MGNLPKQGSAVQRMANALTNRTLSVRIGMLKNNRRVFDKATTDALLDEASRRLYWQDAYDKHNDAEKVEVKS